MASTPTSQSITAQLQAAVRLHQAGQLREAERGYDAVLKLAPAHADALNLKGMIALAQNRIQEATSLLQRAAASAPSYAPIQLNLGNAFAAATRADDALGCYRKAIALNPAFGDAHLNAGLLLEKLGRHQEALAAYRTMTHSCPNDARGFRALGLCLTIDMNAATAEKRAEIAAEAGSAFERACALNPAGAESHFDYANILVKYGDYKNAIAYFRIALTAKADWPEAISNLGEALRKNKQPDEAVALQRQALALRPGDQNILIHLGNALLESRAFEEAETVFRDLMARDPTAVLPYVNISGIYRELSRTDDALTMCEDALLRLPETYEPYGSMATAFSDRGWFASADLLNKKALSLKGTNPKVLLNQGLVILALGRLQEGWARYEARFESLEMFKPKRPTPPPYWCGEDIRNSSIMVWTEQGIGDEILYASMLPDLIDRVRRCVIACSERMVPIFARSFPSCTVVGYHESAWDITSDMQCDYQTAIASLGQYLRPDLASFPRHAGYLKPNPETARHLRKRYEALAAGRRIVGIAWRSKAPQGEAKSMALMDLAPLLATANVFFVNLQYGDCRTEIADVAAKLGIDVYEDAAVDPLTDMDASFAQVAAMDLVITTSNTTAHAAGAQNIPAWVMLPFGRGALWYWFLHHQQSVWYPSLSLIRAPDRKTGHPWWEGLVERTGQRLDTWARQAKL